MPGVITLLTDFGTRDVYAGVMKGVILTINPQAQIVDLSHDVGQQDVAEAAWLLRAAYRYFPPGAVHAVVVDPGVGTPRRAIAASAGGMLFAAPDNGVLMPTLDDAGGATIVEITDRSYMLLQVSNTFHGRDVFAPVAAHLSLGVPLAALGPEVGDPVRLPRAAPLVLDDRIECEVVHVDRFGNLVTNLDRARFDAWRGTSRVLIEAGQAKIEGIAETYGTGADAENVALFESTGHLEIASRARPASEELHLRRGSTITVRRA